MEATPTMDPVEIGPDLKETLAPLLAQRDQLLAHEERLEGEKQAVRAKRIRIEKGLRSFGVIEPEPKRKKREPNNGSYPNTRRAQENVQAVEAFIDSLKDDEDFQVKTIEDATSITRSGVMRILEHLHEHGKIRLLGMQPQIGRTTPGGRKAVTYRKVS